MQGPLFSDSRDHSLTGGTVSTHRMMSENYRRSSYDSLREKAAKQRARDFSVIKILEQARDS